MKSIGLNSTSPKVTVITIPDYLNFESYLIQEGYQVEIKQAILDFKKTNGEISNAKHLEAKEKEISNMSDNDIIQYMGAYKTKLSPYYSFHISSLPNNRSIPSIIRSLFDDIAKAIREVRV